MLGLDRGLSYEQQGKGAGQGGHTVHQVDGDGKACLSSTDGGKRMRQLGGKMGLMTGS